MPGRTPRPLIAVVGSLDRTRTTYEPPLRHDLDQGWRACAELGAALAEAGCDLLLFDASAEFIENAVAAGYAAACTAERPGRIVAKPARHQQFTLDPPPGEHVRVQTLPDTSAEWEVSFYRSLLRADAVLLIGGGRTTRVAGIVAMAEGVPVLPVAAFGGGAGQVWVNLDRERGELTDEDMGLLGAPWTGGSAPALAALLIRRVEHRAAVDAERVRGQRRQAAAAVRGRIVAALALVLALAGIAVADGTGPADLEALALLLSAPMLAAVGGALIRDTFAADQQWTTAAVRGLGAGVVVVLVYVAGQLLALPDLLDRLDTRRLLFFVVPLGFAAGFTFDLVFDRLRSTGPELFPPGAAPPGPPAGR
jgi:hypothetical protein